MSIQSYPKLIDNLAKLTAIEAEKTVWYHTIENGVVTQKQGLVFVDAFLRRAWHWMKRTQNVEHENCRSLFEQVISNFDSIRAKSAETDIKPLYKVLKAAKKIIDSYGLKPCYQDESKKILSMVCFPKGLPLYITNLHKIHKWINRQHMSYFDRLPTEIIVNIFNQKSSDGKYILNERDLKKLCCSYSIANKLIKSNPELIERIVKEKLRFARQDDDVLPLFNKHGSKLKNLDLSLYKDYLTDAHLEKIVSFCPNLLSLSLGHCSMLTDQGLAGLKSLKQLESLDLTFCNISDAALVHVKELTYLKKLNLAELYSITDSGLEHLKTLTSLKELDLGGCIEITDSGVMHLSEIPLHTLNLDLCKKITGKALKYFTSLQTLDLDLNAVLNGYYKECISLKTVTMRMKEMLLRFQY
jgi:Leucine-rich repeat (LRR) protein